METNTKRRGLEKKLQSLIRAHPYLLDTQLLHAGRGRTELAVSKGRLDIAFVVSEGLVVVECKITPLVDDDTRQLCRYLDELAAKSIPISKAYLVGRPPSSDLDPKLLEHPPGIRLVYLLRDVPAHLSFCEGRHYFDTFAEKCPYCGERPIPGKELMLQF
jgi:hypothetical protein